MSFRVALLAGEGEQARATISASASVDSGTDTGDDSAIEAGEDSAGAAATVEMNKRKVRNAGESSWTMMKSDLFCL